MAGHFQPPVSRRTTATVENERVYSPFVDRDYPDEVLFGDLCSICHAPSMIASVGGIPDLRQMSAETRTKRVTIPDIRARKGGEPIVCLTSISAQTSKLLDEHVDLLLVGDSLGMVFYGMDSTVGVTMEMMIGHGASVVRGSNTACVIVDMPFGSYQESPQQAFRNAARVACASPAGQGAFLLTPSSSASTPAPASPTKLIPA